MCLRRVSTKSAPCIRFPTLSEPSGQSGSTASPPLSIRRDHVDAALFANCGTVLTNMIHKPMSGQVRRRDAAFAETAKAALSPVIGGVIESTRCVFASAPSNAIDGAAAIHGRSRSHAHAWGADAGRKNRGRRRGPEHNAGPRHAPLGHTHVLTKHDSVS